jgi:hypothetical protein
MPTRILTFASDVDLETIGVQLIKGVLSSASKAVLFAVSRAAKTFLAIDMTFAIVLDRPFLGRKTTRGAVLIVPLEGRAGFKKRLKAAKLVHGNAGKMIGIMEDAGTLGPGPTSAGFVAATIANARSVDRARGERGRLGRDNGGGWGGAVRTSPRYADSRTLTEPQALEVG